MSYVPITVHQGSNTLFIPVRPEIKEDTEIIGVDWVCKTAVLNMADESVIDVATITLKTEDDLHFLVGLTPIQTALLTGNRSPTEYKWVIQLSNASLGYSKEKHIALYVKKQGIT